MSTIASVETGYYKVPLPVVLTDSTHGEMRAFELVTARLRDDQGAEGVGYTFTVGRNGAAVAATLERDVPDLLEGEDPDLIERLWLKLWWALHYGGRGGAAVFAMSAVDMALWDLCGKDCGQPLHHLFGGPVRDGLDYFYYLAQGTPDELRAQCADGIERGYRWFYLKVGLDAQAEEGMLEAVRAAIGPGGHIRIDANEAWSRKEAIRYLVMVNEVAGADWLDPDWFRFGASTLLNDLLMQRTKMRTGRYSGPDYFTKD